MVHAAIGKWGRGGRHAKKKLGHGNRSSKNR
jgi:hypothetical protein